MPLITEDVAADLKVEFAKLKNPVRLAVFSQALADPESEQVKRLVEELGALDPKLTAEGYNFVLDKEKAEALGIARIARDRRARRRQGLRHALLRHAQRLRVRLAGRRDPGRLAAGRAALGEPTRQALAALDEERAHPGVLDADVTLLPPGGPPGLPVRGRERQDHRRRRRGHRLPGAGAAVPISGGAQDRGGRDPRVRRRRARGDAAGAREAGRRRRRAA